MTYGGYLETAGADRGDYIVNTVDGAGKTMFTKTADRFALINELTGATPSFSWSVSRPYKLTYFNTLNKITHTTVAANPGYYYLAFTTDAGSAPSPRKRLLSNNTSGGTETDYYLVNADTGAATYVFSNSSTGNKPIENAFFLDNELYVVHYDVANNDRQVFIYVIETTQWANLIAYQAMLSPHTTLSIAKYGKRIIGVVGGNGSTTAPRVIEYSPTGTIKTLYLTNFTVNTQVADCRVENNIVWFRTLAGAGSSGPRVCAYGLDDGLFAAVAATGDVAIYIDDVKKDGTAIIVPGAAGSPKQIALIEKDGTSISVIDDAEYLNANITTEKYIWRLFANNQFVRFNNNNTNSGLHVYNYATTPATTNTGGNFSTYPGGTPDSTLSQKTNTTSGTPWALRSQFSPPNHKSLPTLGDYDIVVWTNQVAVAGLYLEETVTLP